MSPALFELWWMVTEQRECEITDLGASELQTRAREKRNQFHKHHCRNSEVPSDSWTWGMLKCHHGLSDSSWVGLSCTGGYLLHLRRTSWWKVPAGSHVRGRGECHAWFKGWSPSFVPLLLRFQFGSPKAKWMLSLSNIKVLSKVCPGCLLTFGHQMLNEPFQSNVQFVPKSSDF